MASEQFSLCWDNFHKNMSSGMNSLLESEDLVDVTLAVEGKYLKAHKMVLSVCSPYFRELFKTNPCKHPIVFMKDVSYVAMSDLLQFMYQGEVQVSQENLTTFIKTAEALQIKGLTGDGNGSADCDNDQDEPKTAEIEPPKVPTQRTKKMIHQPPTPPAPKRPRLSAAAETSVVSAALTKTEPPAPQTSSASSNELVQFKMEPYDQGQSAVTIPDDNQDETFNEDPLDESNADDGNEDYSMMEGGDEEPQAGTSADGTAGEGQGMVESDDESYSDVEYKPAEIFVEENSLDQNEVYSDSESKPPAILQAAEENPLLDPLLPFKSQERYEFVYNQFMNWRQEKGVKSSFSENILLAYFNELSTKAAPTTLWVQYSMLKNTLSSHHSVDISKHARLKAFLKRKSAGYKPKKSKTLTPAQITRFLCEAPDERYLLQKVVLIIGISGACRKNELVQLKIDDFEEHGSAVLVKIPDTKTTKQRSFVIAGEFFKFYKKYADLRPAGIDDRRFFLTWRSNKCTKQPVGMNKIGSTPKQIATYLGLKEPELYTGHCYRRFDIASR